MRVIDEGWSKELSDMAEGKPARDINQKVKLPTSIKKENLRLHVLDGTDKKRGDPQMT